MNKRRKKKALTKHKEGRKLTFRDKEVINNVTSINHPNVFCQDRTHGCYTGVW